MTIVGNIFFKSGGFIYSSFYFYKKNWDKEKNQWLSTICFFVEKETFFNKSDYFDEVLFRMCEVV